MKDPAGINFNRPALAAAVQAARRRTLRSSLGVGYVIVLCVLGGYLLVQAVLLQHAVLVARTALGTARGLEGAEDQVLKVDPAFLDMMQQVAAPDKRWTPKLERLALLLPDNAWIVKLDAGLESTTLTDLKRRRLTLNVSAVVRREEDKVLFPMRFVESLQKDAVFSAGYSDIRFAATRVVTGSQAVVVNFDVECR